MSMHTDAHHDQSLSRRHFLGSALGGALAGSSALHAAEPPAPVSKPKRKIRIGIVGGGHRGTFIGGLMQEHGGYEIHAVADYFPAVAAKLGDAFGVDAKRRFSGLSGYRRVLESGVEAIAILDVPCFYPEQATAAVDASCHVYIAKPIAVDVPGVLAIRTAGQEATRKQRCFHVDYQLPYDPANREVLTRVRDGAVGSLVHAMSYGKLQAWPDPRKGATIEDRLQHNVWLSDIALGGDTIVHFDIHIIDPIILLAGKPAASACGASRACRPDPHGDRIDACGVVFEFEDGTIWTHITQSINNNADFSQLSAHLYGLTATARIGYFAGKIYVRGGTKHYVGDVSKQIYREGAAYNVADFYRCVEDGRFDNATVSRAVNGTLTAILGRDAAARHARLTMHEVLEENRKLEVDPTGLRG